MITETPENCPPIALSEEELLDLTLTLWAKSADQPETRNLAEDWEGFEA